MSWQPLGGCVIDTAKPAASAIAAGCRGCSIRSVVAWCADRPPIPYVSMPMSTGLADKSLPDGKAPPITLNRILDGTPGTVLTKVEGRNLASSAKYRIRAEPVRDAAKRCLPGTGKDAHGTDAPGVRLPQTPPGQPRAVKQESRPEARRRKG